MGSLATFEVGNYEIFRKRIGKGAFSTVYKGYNKITNELIAVKEISLDTLNKYEKTIKRETEIMKKLNHPYIIKLYDTLIDNNTENVYLVMQYCEKGDLAKYLNKRPLKEKYALKYLKQISEAIKYLLESNILHRDLKPNNILMTNVGNIALTDFGFARYFESDLLLQTICGSPLYMAPEIIKNKKYDYKSDLWSIGIIFYEMLMGFTPFKAKNIYELIRKIENDDIIIPNKFNISYDSRDLLYSLLQKNPLDRITYEDFFDFHLLSKCDPFEEENKLMEISNLNNFPLIPNKKNRFINNSINNNDPNINMEINKSINNSYGSLNSLNSNLLSPNNNSKIITSNLDSSFYNKNEDFDLNLEFNFNLNNSSIVNIEDSNTNDFLNLNIEEDYFRSSLNINNDLLTDYVIVSSTRNNSNSISNYISKSLYFIKESYKFFSNYNSI